MNLKKVRCDNCSKEFKIKKILKTKKKDGLEGEVTIHYFSCPSCKTKYTTLVENDELRKLIRETKQAYSKIRQLKDLKEIEEAFERYDELEKKRNRVAARLKSKFKL
ncbi:hypothetical protein [Ornithinibacillus sp. JPR2-1]|uniref:hypothetical protein n=1 Tax=Ornithinibacillus sp. JPR2-1 TaxID=2094019 RepID=UPI0031CEC688